MPSSHPISPRTAAGGRKTDRRQPGPACLDAIRWATDGEQSPRSFRPNGRRRSSEGTGVRASSEARQRKLGGGPNASGATGPGNGSERGRGAGSDDGSPNASLTFSCEVRARERIGGCSSPCYSPGFSGSSRPSLAGRRTTGARARGSAPRSPRDEPGAAILGPRPPSQRPRRPVGFSQRPFPRTLRVLLRPIGGSRPSRRAARPRPRPADGAERPAPGDRRPAPTRPGRTARRPRAPLTGS